MSYSAKIICDSISETGKRITTFEVTFPRIVLAEFNTHRMFSRNSASSRAIPFQRQLDRILENPFIPEQFPINGKGMQPNSYIYGNSDVYIEAKESWLKARDKAVESAIKLYNCLAKFEDAEHKIVNIHKQIVNRLLEPFMWHTVIVTATEFDNFFKLRTNSQAQYEIRRIADLMYEAYHAFDYDWQTSDAHYRKFIVLNNEPIWEAVRPKLLKQNEWHLPFISDEDEQLIDDFIPLYHKYLDETIDNFGVLASQEQYQEIEKRVSVARCARVSYLTHDGKRDIEKDLELFERLRTSGHWSPFEHVATSYFEDFTKFSQDIKSSRDNNPLEMSNLINKMREGFSISRDFKDVNLRSGNFIGWKSFRKEFQDENCTYFKRKNN